MILKSLDMYYSRKLLFDQKLMLLVGKKFSACNCDPAGSQNGGICDRYSDFSVGLIAGQCRCKSNIEGERCDRCKEGHYDLSAEDPDGCQRKNSFNMCLTWMISSQTIDKHLNFVSCLIACGCNSLGTIPGGISCDSVEGNCYCKRFVMGKQCDQCMVIKIFWMTAFDFCSFDSNHYFVNNIRQQGKVTNIYCIKSTCLMHVYIKACSLKHCKIL